MSDKPKVVWIEYRWDDGTIRRATGDDADAIDRHIAGMFAEMQLARGRMYTGPTLQVVEPDPEAPR